MKATINECIFYGNSAEKGAAIYFMQKSNIRNIMMPLKKKCINRSK